MEYADAGDHGEDEDFFKLRHEQKTVKKLHMETDAMLSLKERKVEKKKRDITARVKKSEKLGLPPESDSDSDYEGAAASDNGENNNKVEVEDITKSGPRPPSGAAQQWEGEPDGEGAHNNSVRGVSGVYIDV